MVMELFTTSLKALIETDADNKCRLVEALHLGWLMGEITRDERAAHMNVTDPGRPARPELVPPLEVPRRKMTTPAGRAAMIHALAHIEFNAVNLALDAAYRFRDMPMDFYGDWLKVAAEEALHFKLLRGHLRSMGYDYGDFPAHNGLWEMAMKTAHDPLVRMALVPRVLEARGLDVTPGLIKRLRQAGDEKTAAVLEIILRDEIGHVAIGSHWFQYLCGQRGLDPEQTFHELVNRYFSGQRCGPFDYEARQQAGFSLVELKALEQMGIAKTRGGNTTQ